MSSSGSSGMPLDDDAAEVPLAEVVLEMEAILTAPRPPRPPPPAAGADGSAGLLLVGEETLMPKLPVDAVAVGAMRTPRPPRPPPTKTGAGALTGLLFDDADAIDDETGDAKSCWLRAESPRLRDPALEGREGAFLLVKLIPFSFPKKDDLLPVLLVLVVLLAMDGAKEEVRERRPETKEESEESGDDDGMVGWRGRGGQERVRVSR